MAQPNNVSPMVAYERAIATATLANVDTILSLRERAIPREDSPTLEAQSARLTALDKTFAKKAASFGLTYEQARDRFAESGLAADVISEIDPARYGQERAAATAQNRAQWQQSRAAETARVEAINAADRKEHQDTIASVPEIVANAVRSGNFEGLAGFAASYSDDSKLYSGEREKRAEVRTAIQQAYAELPANDKAKFVVGLTAAIKAADENTTRISEALPKPKAVSADNPYADEANWVDTRPVTEAGQKGSELRNLEAITGTQTSSLSVPAKAQGQVRGASL